MFRVLLVLFRGRLLLEEREVELLLFGLCWALVVLGWGVVCGLLWRDVWFGLMLLPVFGLLRGGWGVSSVFVACDGGL